MRPSGLFPSAFLNTVFFLVTGVLNNGDQTADAAALDQRHLGQSPIDRPSKSERSRLFMGFQARGYPVLENRIYHMQRDVPRNVESLLASQSRDDWVMSDSGDSSHVLGSRSIPSRQKRQADQHRRDEDQHFHDQQHAINSKYHVEVTLKEEMKNSSIVDVMHQIKQQLAHFLEWHEGNIHADKIIFERKQVDLLFSYPKEDEPIPFYFPAENKVKEHAMFPLNQVESRARLLKDLQTAVPELMVQDVAISDREMDGVTFAVYTGSVIMQNYFPYIISAGCILIVVVISLTSYVCFCRTRESAPISSATNGLGSHHSLYHQQQQQEQQLQQQHVLFPDVVAPDTGSPLAIQPCAAPVFVPVGYVTTPVPAQPMRVKRKGLLESRRGSNASLTLDLQPSPEIGRWDGTPPKESSGLEYLMSAGNRLSRRDLRNAAKNTKILYEEFWEIPMNHPEKVSVAGSGMKNRYKTIIPNEHTRVVLPDADQDPLTSYINANYIRGYEGEPHAYVATQGPMAHTLEDFWQMIWHLHCPIIVMITKLKEKSKPKCENYLPEHYGIYGDTEVTVTKVIQKKGYVVRHLHLKCDGESRMLLHFWYTAWPDHKPPDSPSMLLELVKEVELRRYCSDGVTPRGPVVVHCSAGIGRTGCFVAISIGIRQLREEHSVDVLGVVCGMRLDRGGMIQTHEQYDFVHQALCEYERTLGEPSIQSITALTSEGH